MRRLPPSGTVVCIRWRRLLYQENRRGTELGLLHRRNIGVIGFGLHPNHGSQTVVCADENERDIGVWKVERFWTLEAHPTLNLLAAGHDAGLLVFKLVILNTANKEYYKLNIPSSEDLFSAGQNSVLLKDKKGLSLFDVKLNLKTYPANSRVLGMVEIAKCREAIWSSNLTRVALLSKNAVVICTRHDDNNNNNNQL
ncbi:hypothetical protein Pcinc_019445 [Petrolisthes cinctipes]|uniref:Uncharacterized protein n=1 Tax=Petrolisthes cinctipes TaxID=88211 RepID=A0AAE1FK37_PETCI|nr:hypothetical protein Pcinc_019445 [Petrolisthes cinctipes]